MPLTACIRVERPLPSASGWPEQVVPVLDAARRAQALELHAGGGGQLGELKAA